MLYELLTLTSILTSRGVLAADQADSLAKDAAVVVEQRAALFDGEDGRLRTARLLVVWSAKESAGIVNIMGDCTSTKKSVETCRSFGRMQTSLMWLSWFGYKPSDVLSDGRLALLVSLDVMLLLRTKCGSVKGALRAYASGQCAGTPRARALVESRCKEAGGC